MIAIICIDNNNGTMFNNRRKSRDRFITDKILEFANGKRLWMRHYSYVLFKNEDNSNINIDDNFLMEVTDKFCFVEGQSLKEYERWIEKIIIFKQSRTYPADEYFDIELSHGDWKRTKTEDFVGNSHKRITMEVHEK